MSEFSQRFTKFISDQSLFSAQDTVLAAVSGGADSILMANLLLDCGFKTAIAHCNFQLRGDESDEDAFFVEKFARINRLPFHQIEFEAEKYATKNKLSIEMAARELRYNWFQELKLQFGYSVIALAHHAADVVETFHINLSRGAGLKGLTGIKAKNGDLVRPLLFATKQEILNEIEKSNLQFRTDSSNLENIYTRNKFRLDIIPQLEKINPAYQSAVVRSVELLDNYYQLVKNAVQQAREACISFEEGVFTLQLEKLKKYNPLKIYLYEFLQEFGINYQQTNHLISSLDSTETLEFKTKTATILKDRDCIYAFSEEENIREFQIEKGLTKLEHPIALNFVYQKKDEHFTLIKDSSLAMLDADLLEFPLTLRLWKEGDTFQPIGMNGRKKKVSDYFTDIKLNALQKRKTYLLESKGEIVWIVGLRLSEGFKITDKTKNTLTINILQ